ncbi:hypothetical protein DL764_007903 [Monosporascus ibericus]|uniref:Uncharacterized protein n=1 Tax=Monosporascus ibericus TaxID=155417 RepID=A0A4Q4T2B3_9PEZI|nr:hypothetical protein DL764_007903 [Monosporascus ibericus]
MVSTAVKFTFLAKAAIPSLRLSDLYRRLSRRAGRIMNQDRLLIPDSRCRLRSIALRLLDLRGQNKPQRQGEVVHAVHLRAARPLASSAAATTPPTQGYPYKQGLGIAEAVRADLRWFNVLAAEFFLSSEQETAAVKAMMLPNLAPVPQYYIALDLNGGQRQMKVYFCPLIKHMTTGMNSGRGHLQHSRPPRSRVRGSLKVIGDFRVKRPEPVKLHTRTESKAWDNIRHQVTLGGRRNDETTLKGLEILGEIWNLLLDEPETTLDSSVSKPVNDPTTVWRASIIHSWKVYPGKDLPDVKVEAGLGLGYGWDM